MTAGLWPLAERLGSWRAGNRVALFLLLRSLGGGPERLRGGRTLRAGLAHTLVAARFDASALGCDVCVKTALCHYHLTLCDQ